MANISRRRFLKSAAGTGMAGFAALHGMGCASFAQISAGLGEGAYGPLERAGPDLKLPPGFQYKKFSLAGSIMSDGYPVPQAHDGMAAFPMENGNIRLIRNHEVAGRPRDYPIITGVYDPLTGGGTTSLEVDPVTREVVREFTSLAGTAVNCAGGPTPWGTWLSCEEIVVGPRSGVASPHGYVFEVSAAAEEFLPPRPLKGLGRFIHEAAAVDPQTSIVYLTEDQIRAGFYRFVPEQPARNDESADLAAGGRLEMLAIDGAPKLSLNSGRTVGEVLVAKWVPIWDPDPADAAKTPASVFRQGWGQGAAMFSRIEGCFYGDRGIYFSCTHGGDVECGQIWHYQPAEADWGLLKLVFESPTPSILESPDNICVSPRGGVVITEDGEYGNSIRGLTPDGKMFDFAENVANRSELAGPTFSPDGQTLFVNIQRGPGATYAIWGPWEDGGL
ncbi:MAG: DUF839 domain-containing protein [Gemmatimonadetes bacterium]|nr:DUF839 domain-containing protein [Gemmatimonadota bacterium]